MDPDRFQQLVDAWYDPLYRFALSLARNADDALDLTQQTFARWAEKGHHLRDDSRAKSWLFTVLYREFVNSRRHRHRELNLLPEDLPDDNACGKDRSGNRIDGAAAIAALWELDEPFRAPITLFYLQNHSYREIAGILDIPIGTVMSRLARAREQLRARLEGSAHPEISIPENRPSNRG